MQLAENILQVHTLDYTETQNGRTVPIVLPQCLLYLFLEFHKNRGLLHIFGSHKLQILRLWRDIKVKSIFRHLIYYRYFYNLFLPGSL